MLALPTGLCQAGGMQPAAPLRQSVWELLGCVLDERRTLDEAMAAFAAEEDARHALRAWLLPTLRHLGQIDALLNARLAKPVPARHRAVMHALRLGVAQLLLLEVPRHAAVHETVAMVKASRHAPLAGMVNAVLKTIDGPLPDCRHNLPAWLEQRWKAHYGKAVSDAICVVANGRPPLDVNGVAAFAEGERLDGAIWRMAAPYPPVPELEGYAAGAFFVQDIAASYPVRMLGAVKDRTVLDIGAAPGGKTAQLARAGALVTALDKSEARMARLRRNMQRLKLEVQTVVADACDYATAVPFDIVLLDAPCSATGTWRRHPEVVHITTAADIAELVQRQRELLRRAWGWMKPGGRLLYCVCSLEREEGEDQRDWFLRQFPDAVLMRPEVELPGLAPDGTLRTTPAMLAGKGGMDGFFAMTIAKK